MSLAADEDDLHRGGSADEDAAEGAAERLSRPSKLSKPSRLSEAAGSGRAGGRTGTAGRGAPGRRRAITVVLVLILVVGAGCAGAEIYVRSLVSSAVHAALPGLSSDAAVETEGIVVPQVLGGELRSLSVSADKLTLGSEDSGQDGAGREESELLDVDASATSVGLSSPYSAGTLDIEASLGWDRLASMVKTQAPDAPEMTIKAGTLGSGDDPGTLSASAGVLGLGTSANVTPSVAPDGGLRLTITSVTVQGSELPADSQVMGRPVLSYAGLSSSEISISADRLPRGLTLKRVWVTDGGLRLALSGTKVDLSGM